MFEKNLRVENWDRVDKTLGKIQKTVENIWMKYGGKTGKKLTKRWNKSSKS